MRSCDRADPAAGGGGKEWGAQPLPPSSSRRSSQRQPPMPARMASRPRICVVPQPGAPMNSQPSARPTSRPSTPPPTKPSASASAARQAALKSWLIAAASAVAALHVDELLEQGQVLLVLQQRAHQRRDRDLVVLRLQRLGRDVLGQQQLEPVDQL